eukprot:CAMPEP_0201523466 /NCGR_PEP_ID=MMETSP0161_2-20130828/20000_1 /ASSEMBLY_ACC=CAM_ASM_000251 /TAXON_ID=180227 /ORGANISM="Neoparamoeba aestuarina, Strain SoJaBio B1-5/56/2" /LENGTH=215 /DNA_ID=CAMNT_0047922593 /DNA_START=33 /DNA_END=680 /DNA_ORIENTATION=+
MASSLLENGDSVRFVSLKVADQPPPRDAITVRSGGEVVSCGRPSTNLKERQFSVKVVGENVFQFESASQPGQILYSNASTHEVSVGQPGNPQEGHWSLFHDTATKGEVRPATALKKVFLRNLATEGFMSVRDHESWTAEGKVWTRDEKGGPAGPYSWESFEVSLQNRKSEQQISESMSKEVEKLREENERLRKENEELKKYKNVVVGLKGLLEQC